MAISRRSNEELSALEQLITNINETMISFKESTGKQQNEEQKKGLNLIRSDFEADRIEADLTYFIGRYQKLSDESEDIREVLAKKLGLSNVAGIKIERSRDPSMVKVSLKGSAINDFVSPKPNVEQANEGTFEEQPSQKIKLSDETLTNIFFIISGDFASTWSLKSSQIVSPVYDPKKATQKLNDIKEQLQNFGMDTRNNLIFTSTSSECDEITGNPKKRVIVNEDKFNQALDSEVLNKIEEFISEKLNRFLTSIKDEQALKEKGVGGGSGIFMGVLHARIQECEITLASIKADRQTSEVTKKPGKI